MRFYKKTLKKCTHPQNARCKKQIINRSLVSVRHTNSVENA